ncbi:cold-shock protein [Hymenobacter lapidiphilus]|uniref:Cold shock domain-containing protein n=1 Tax=Hymenobacter lapidiphilus TaxID=2608003 RepID=A0A7Y7U6L3_9BACT|nr:cold shock domain-containing protein [Hymenobacter lapidiphilus]NVO32941.1 cold shock domain-containing protein [Hymenobacter lapidiphilus]
MGRSQATFGKRENEKKRLKKRQEKAEKKEERLANSSKGQGLDEMMAYVDENGNIVDTPPDPTKKKKEIPLESIRIGAIRQEDIEEEDPVRSGSVTFFNDSKGYGFIKDLATQQSVFVHANNLGSLTIKENDKVTFEVEMGQKGPSAFNVKMAVAG